MGTRTNGSGLGQGNNCPGSIRPRIVVKTYASGTVDAGLIPSRIKSMVLKLVFTAILLDSQQ